MHTIMNLYPGSLMIENNFPIQVFALDPQVQEQNVFVAFSRRAAD